MIFGRDIPWVNFSERRTSEVRTIYLLVTRAELLRRCRTRRNPGTSVKPSIPENRPTPPAMPCDHLQRTDARDEALGHYSTADVLLTKPPIFWSEALRFYGFCRQKREPTSGLEPLSRSSRVMRACHTFELPSFRKVRSQDTKDRFGTILLPLTLPLMGGCPPGFTGI